MWNERAFQQGLPALAQTTNGSADSDHATFEWAGRYMAVESAADLDPRGLNADGNTEIFLYDTVKNTWTQITDTVAPVQNHRPDISGARLITFESNGNLNNNPKCAFNNNDNGDRTGNREIFQALPRRTGVVFTQLTNTQAPVENIHGASRIGRAVFTSDGDLNTDPTVTSRNTDGNREVFRWTRQHGQAVITQLTDSVAGANDGENVNPSLSPLGRYVVFESTADLEADGSTNRRVFQFDQWTGKLLKLSRSRFGENFTPRSNGVYIVWESTANLTGHNPSGDRVVYFLNRHKAEKQNN